jgi:hypothetical protein
LIYRVFFSKLDAFTALRFTGTGTPSAAGCTRVLPMTQHAAARVRARVWSCGICGGKVALGQVSSQYFGFPCQSSSTNCSTITLIYHLRLYNRPEVAAVPSGLSPTPLKKNGFTYGKYQQTLAHLTARGGGGGGNTHTKKQQKGAIKFG